MSDPLYLSIYQNLEHEIVSGKYPINSRLASEHELATQYHVSTITIKKSLDLLKEDGYIIRKPRKGSIVVSTTKTGTSGLQTTGPTIGLVITNFNDVFGAQILRSIATYNKSPINIVLKMSNGVSEVEDKQIAELMKMGVDGIILLPSSSVYTSPQLLKLISKGFPIVIIDRLMADLPICSVKTDSVNASKVLTQYLFDNGHRHVGIVTSNSHVTTIDERVNGFLTAHIENNIAINQNQILSTIKSVVPDSTSPVEDDIETIMEYLDTNPNITGIVTTEYNIALLVKSAIERIHHKIPDDYSVVCFDHPTVSVFDENAFTFTHIHQGQTEMGTSAIDLVLEKMKHSDMIRKLSLPYQLVPGDSVRQLKA